MHWLGRPASVLTKLRLGLTPVHGQCQRGPDIVTHYYELCKLGLVHVERETFDSALMSGRSALELLGFQPHQARTLALRFRKHNVEQFEELRQHLGDVAKLIALAKQGRRQLEELFAREREQARKRAHRIGWDKAEGDR